MILSTPGLPSMQAGEGNCNTDLLQQLLVSKQPPLIILSSTSSNASFTCNESTAKAAFNCMLGEQAIKDYHSMHSTDEVSTHMNVDTSRSQGQRTIAPSAFYPVNSVP